MAYLKGSDFMSTGKKLYKSRFDKKISGVCGGIGEYFNIDSTIIRLIWALVSLGSFGTGLVIYIITALLIPQNPNDSIVIDE